MPGDIHYAASLEGVEPRHLRGFFEGWPGPPSPDTHLALLGGSSHVVIAWSEDEVVGFVTAVSDGVLAAYLPLLEVRKQWRGRGIGSALVRRILEQVGDLYMVDVVCDDDVRPFYERLGFGRINGMILRDHAALAKEAWRQDRVR